MSLPWNARPVILRTLWGQGDKGYGNDDGKGEKGYGKGEKKGYGKA